jgi:uncharacterized protein
MLLFQPKVYMFLIIAIVVIIKLVISPTLFDYIKSKLYYLPHKQMLSKPNMVDNVFLTNQNNEKQNGWYYDSNSSKVILFCHGNAGNISYRKHILNKCIEQNISILMFDYKGFGDSQGETKIESTYDDAVDWMNYLIDVKNYTKNDIIPMGESIGSFPAAKLVAEQKLSKVIIIAGFHSVSDVVNNLFPAPINYLAQYITDGDLQTGKYLKKFTGDTLIFHSKSDEIISYQNAVMNSSYGGKLITIYGGHNDHNIDYKTIKEFIQ